MAQKRRPTQTQATILTKSKSVFETEIDGRIKLGQKIIEDRIGDDEAFMLAKKQFSEWNDYNLELLKQSFNVSTNEYWRSYNDAGKMIGLYTAAMGGQIKPGQILDEFLSRVELKIDNLVKLKNKVNLLKSEEVEKEEILSNIPLKKIISTNTNENTMDIFISHSSQDSDIAKLLIDLLKSSLNLKSSKIRCTSVNGYRLPAGATTNDLLKQEVHESKILIGLISANSINSAYVLFELGARWGASLPLIPLITSELGSELLKGPLSGINALNCCESAQLQQLISDLKSKLEIDGELPEVYQDKIDILVNHCLKEILPDKILEVQIQSTDNKLKISQQTNDEKIKSYCEKEWPDDYSMRVHCIKQQKAGREDMNKLKPNNIPEDVFNRIIQKAKSEWPNDYTMQVHSRDEQIEAFIELSNL